MSLPSSNVKIIHIDFRFSPLLTRPLDPLLDEACLHEGRALTSDRSVNCFIMVVYVYVMFRTKSSD